jgi:hypothetical protein
LNLIRVMPAKGQDIVPTTSIFLAKLIGPLFVALGLAMLVNPAVSQTMSEEFLRSHALIFLSGLITLVAGLAIVNLHNAWTRDWRVIITVLGWLSVIGGIFRIALPQAVASIGMAMFAHRTTPLVAGVVMLALGGFLSFKGYQNLLSQSGALR